MGIAKELEWEEITSARCDEDPTPEHTGDYEAVSAIGVYYIEMYMGSDSYGWRVTMHGSDDVADKDDPSDAKAAAQADYDRRIRASLSPSALASIEMREEMVKALRDCLWCLEALIQMQSPDWDGTATEPSTIGSTRALLTRIGEGT